MQIADRCTTWKIASGAKNLVLRALQFYLNRIKVEVILRPTVSRLVYLGIRHPFDTCDQFLSYFLIIFVQLRICCYGTPSLTRGRVCSLQLLLGLSSAVIFGSEPRGIHDHIFLSQI
jgi:hypothetical protein